MKTNYAEFITEAVYGHQAIVYHRTGSQPEYKDLLDKSIVQIRKYKKLHTKENLLYNSFSVIQNIVTRGFNRNESNVGKVYGAGIYCTYDLESQLNQVGNEHEMEKMYGKIIIKSKLNLTNFLILDYKIAEKVYGKKHTLIDQCTKLGLTKIASDIRKPNSPIAITLKSFSDIIYSNDEKQEIVAFTDRILTILIDYYFVDKKIAGVIYTNMGDGHVVLVYNEKLLVPYSFGISENNQMVIPWVRYNKYFNKELIKGYVDSLVDEFDDSQKNRITQTIHTDEYELHKKITHSNLSMIKKNNKFGVINNNTLEEIIKPIYDEIADNLTTVDGKLYHYFILTSNKKNKMFLIDQNGKTLFTADKITQIYDQKLTAFIIDDGVSHTVVDLFGNYLIKPNDNITHIFNKNFDDKNIKVAEWIDGKPYKNVLYDLTTGVRVKY